MMPVLSENQQRKGQEERRDGGDGWKREKELLYEVNAEAMSGGRNELISKFKMVMGDVIGIRGSL